jgi:hypothetical protein
MARPRSEGKRNAILAATSDLVAEQGLGAATAEIVPDLATAARTDRLAVSLRPAQTQEDILGAAVGHTHDLGRAERARGGGKQKVLSHEGSRQDDVVGHHLQDRQKVQGQSGRWRLLHNAGYILEVEGPAAISPFENRNRTKGHPKL